MGTDSTTDLLPEMKAKEICDVMQARVKASAKASPPASPPCICDVVATAIRAAIAEERARAENAEKEAAAAKRELLWAWEHGLHAHDDGCPEDDTCDCEEIQRLNAALQSDAGPALAANGDLLERAALALRCVVAAIAADGGPKTKRLADALKTAERLAPEAPRG